MIRKTFAALALISVLWAAPTITSLYNLLPTGTAVAQAQPVAPNWFDPSTWMAMPGATTMPGMTGIELAEAVRERNLTIPIALITGVAHTLGDIGVTHEHVGRMAPMAERDPSSPTNPMPLSA